MDFTSKPIVELSCPCFHPMRAHEEKWSVRVGFKKNGTPIYRWFISEELASDFFDSKSRPDPKKPYVDRETNRDMMLTAKELRHARELFLRNNAKLGMSA